MSDIRVKLDRRRVELSFHSCLENKSVRIRAILNPFPAMVYK